jgi:hypothetical protein
VSLLYPARSNILFQPITGMPYPEDEADYQRLRGCLAPNSTSLLLFRVRTRGTFWFRTVRVRSRTMASLSKAVLVAFGRKPEVHPVRYLIPSLKWRAL